MAIYDECDRLYAESKRSQHAVPHARLFKYLVMMSATALRKHSEHVGPRAAIASLFAPVPVNSSNLLVFFAGSVLHFHHEVQYDKEERTEYFSLPMLPSAQGNTFHALAQAAFTASMDNLMKAARENPPSIIVTACNGQVEQMLEKYPDETCAAPTLDDDVLQKSIVVISQHSGRVRNYGKVCNSMVSCPLPSSVSTRRQVRGRITRGPLRTLHYVTVVLEGSVLDFLLKSQRASNAMQTNLENLVVLAEELQKSRRRDNNS